MVIFPKAKEGRRGLCFGPSVDLSSLYDISSGFSYIYSISSYHRKQRLFQTPLTKAPVQLLRLRVLIVKQRQRKHGKSIRLLNTFTIRRHTEGWNLTSSPACMIDWPWYRTPNGEGLKIKASVHIFVFFACLGLSPTLPLPFRSLANLPTP